MMVNKDELLYDILYNRLINCIIEWKKLVEYNSGNLDLKKL